MVKRLTITGVITSLLISAPIYSQPINYLPSIGIDFQSSLNRSSRDSSNAFFGDGSVGVASINGLAPIISKKDLLVFIDGRLSRSDINTRGIHIGAGVRKKFGGFQLGVNGFYDMYFGKNQHMQLVGGFEASNKSFHLRTTVYYPFTSDKKIYSGFKGIEGELSYQLVKSLWASVKPYYFSHQFDVPVKGIGGSIKYQSNFSSMFNVYASLGYQHDTAYAHQVTASAGITISPGKCDPHDMVIPRIERNMFIHGLIDSEAHEVILVSKEDHISNMIEKYPENSVFLLKDVLEIQEDKPIILKKGMKLYGPGFVGGKQSSEHPRVKLSFKPNINKKEKVVNKEEKVVNPPSAAPANPTPQEVKQPKNITLITLDDNTVVQGIEFEATSLGKDSNLTETFIGSDKAVKNIKIINNMMKGLGGHDGSHTIYFTQDVENAVIKENTIKEQGIQFDGAITRSNINNNNIQSSHLGVDVKGSSSNNTIEDNIISSQDSGFKFAKTSQDTIRKNHITIHNVEAEGILVGGEAIGSIFADNMITAPKYGMQFIGDSSKNSIDKNTINASIGGLRLGKISENTIKDNTITVKDSSAEAIHVEGESTDNKILKNQINSQHYAINFTQASEKDTIKGNTLTSSSHSLLFAKSLGNIIEDNTITTTGSGAKGIYGRDILEGNKIIHNTIITEDNGIHAESDFINNHIINDNTITSKKNGLKVEGETHDNQIIGNTINSDVDGMYFQEISGNEITGNKITTTAANADGIYVEVEAKDNHINKNTIHSSYNGMHVQEISGNEITGNKITTIQSNADGIYVRGEAKDNHIKTNTIKAPEHGIWFREDVSGNEITGNEINTNASGMRFGQKISGTTIEGNKITTIQSNADGIYVAGEAKDNHINKNTINSDYPGICFDQEISGTTIEGNEINTNASGMRFSQKISGTTIEGNKITATSAAADGIYVIGEAKDNHIKTNTIKAPEYGIWLKKDASGNEITGNKIDAGKQDIKRDK